MKQPITLDADLTSGMLRFTDPEQLTALVRIMRTIHTSDRIASQLILHKNENGQFSVYENDIDIIQSIADIVLPSDSV